MEADYIVAELGSKEHLKRTIEERQADLVLMGTYGMSVIREVVVGSTLDYMLRESEIPLLICH